MIDWNKPLRRISDKKKAVEIYKFTHKCCTSLSPYCVLFEDGNIFRYTADGACGSLMPLTNYNLENYEENLHVNVYKGVDGTKRVGNNIYKNAKEAQEWGECSGDDYLYTAKLVRINEQEEEDND